MNVKADSERVRELRKEEGTTAKEIVQRAGISTDTLRRVQQGRGPVRVTSERGIGRALDVDPRSFAKAVS